MTDALVVDHRAERAIVGLAFEECDRLQLPPGHSYVVFAKGQVRVRRTTVVLRLEAHGARDETRFSQSPEDPEGEEAFGTFSLALATTVEDDPDLFVVATLSAAQALADDKIGVVSNIKLVALTVDNLSITTV